MRAGASRLQSLRVGKVFGWREVFERVNFSVGQVFGRDSFLTLLRAAALPQLTLRL